MSLPRISEAATSSEQNVGDKTRVTAKDDKQVSMKNLAPTEDIKDEKKK